MNGTLERKLAVYDEALARLEAMKDSTFRRMAILRVWWKSAAVVESGHGEALGVFRMATRLKNPLGSWCPPEEGWKKTARKIAAWFGKCRRRVERMSKQENKGGRNDGH